MKAVIQRRIVPNLDLDIIFDKMKICGVIEKLQQPEVSKCKHHAEIFLETTGSTFPVIWENN